MWVGCRQSAVSKWCDSLMTQGCVVVRIAGSHHVMKRDDIHTTVSVHGKRDLKTGTLRSILRDVDMSVDEFLKRR